MKTRTQPSKSETNEESRVRGLRLLEEAQRLFEDRKPFYHERNRNARYYMGDQWSDIIKDPKTGLNVTEEEYIINDGRTPIKNNLIGKTIRSLIGQFLTNYPDPIVYARNKDNSSGAEKMTSALQACSDKNKLKMIDPREFEEFMISGAFGWKIMYKYWNNLDSEDAFVKQIEQSRFFYNVDSKDIRNFDVSACGELHDITIQEAILKFAKSKKDEERIRGSFPYFSSHDSYYDNQPDHIQQYRDFYVPDNLNNVRVIEYWKQEYGWMEFVHDFATGDYKLADEKYFIDSGIDPEVVSSYSAEELIEIINNDRIRRAMEMNIDPEAVPQLEYDYRNEKIWKVYFLTPYGEILSEQVGPYDHQDNPYVFGVHPLLDGRVQSLSGSLIDQQRFVNRIVQMIDLGMRQKVKNLMWVPVDIIPKGMDFEEFADQTVEYNGMMFYQPKQGSSPPSVISSNSNLAGEFQIMQAMMGMIENISSVNDAVQGNTPHANTPASLYAQQTNNAMIGNKDYFDFFFSKMRERNRKMVQVIQQYYQEVRYVRVAGSGFSKGVQDVYDPEEVRGIDFDVVLGETQDTLVYRQVAEQSLKEYLGAELITFEEYLKESTQPFADRLLQVISNRENITPGEEQQMISSQEGMNPSQQ